MSIHNLDMIKNVSGGIKESTFLDSESYKKANADFKYLCSQTGYNTFNNVGYQRVSTATGKNKDLCEVFVVGLDLAEKTTYIPDVYVDLEDSGKYVGVVCYNGEQVADVLIFANENFKKTGLFSMFKYDKKTMQYGVHISDINNSKLRQYSFGFVLKNLQ